MGMFTGIAGAWLVRRVFEVGGIFAFVASIVAALPPSSQGRHLAHPAGRRDQTLIREKAATAAARNLTIFERLFQKR